MYSDDKEEIKQVFEKTYAENMRTGNMQGYGDMYTKDALWMPPDAIDRHGKDDILKAFAESIASQKVDPVFTAEEIVVMGDFGYVIGNSKATVTPHNSSEQKKVT
ncbi:MAG: nuclear transport factor 2 family protein, partial [Dolichospermum sp.]